MKKICIIILLLCLVGCGKTICTCKNETITTEITKEVIKEVPIEKIIYINTTITQCNDSVQLSLIRRLKHCQELQIKYSNETLCQFDLEGLNQTLNITEHLLNEYKYNQTVCIEDLEDCKEDLEVCENG